MRILTLLLLALLAFLQYQYWTDIKGKQAVTQLRQDMQKQKQLNTQLQQRNDKLYAEIEELQTGLDTIEEHARIDLGMIKPDEVFYQLVEPENQPNP